MGQVLQPQIIQTELTAETAFLGLSQQRGAGAEEEELAAEQEIRALVEVPEVVVEEEYQEARPEAGAPDKETMVRMEIPEAQVPEVVVEAPEGPVQYLLADQGQHIWVPLMP